MLAIQWRLKIFEHLIAKTFCQLWDWFGSSFGDNTGTLVPMGVQIAPCTQGHGPPKLQQSCFPSLFEVIFEKFLSHVTNRVVGDRCDVVGPLPKATLIGHFGGLVRALVTGALLHRGGSERRCKGQHL